MGFRFLSPRIFSGFALLLALGCGRANAADFIPMPVPSPAPAAAPTDCALLYKNTFGPTTEELDLLLRRNGNLFAVMKRSAEETAKLNEDSLKMLRDLPMPPANPKRKAGLSVAEIEALYKAALKNPQVKKSLCGTYNGSGQLGFCWGRAMAVHLQALHSKVSNQSVRKLWAVGEMKSDSIAWRYHVSTVVRSDQGIWYAVDPIFPGPMPVEEWYANLKAGYAGTEFVRLYSTPAKRFGPGKWEKYNKNHLKEAAYYNFFADLMDSIYKENTGREGPWKTIAEEGGKPYRGKARWKLLQKAANYGAASGAAGWGIYELVKPRSQRD